jgi:predicted ester cyclase
MSNIDIAQAGMAAWCKGDTATLGSLLTDDFTLSGPTPQPLNKAAFLGLCGALIAAFPDWNFNATDFREEGDTVYATFHITGTHTGTLAAIPGVPPVPATGKAVSLAADQAVYTMRGGLASQQNITTGPGGGVAGLYAQVGAPLG